LFIGSEINDVLGRPVLPETSDQAAFEDQERDFSHLLAHPLVQVIELSLPLDNGSISVEVKIQQLALDTTLRLDYLFLPVGPNSLATPAL
jgi:hypothetical protein